MIKILTTIISTYFIYCLFVFFMQRFIMFPRYLIGTQIEYDKTIDKIETIWLDTSFR